MLGDSQIHTTIGLGSTQNAPKTTRDAYLSFLIFCTREPFTLYPLHVHVKMSIEPENLCT